MSYNEAMNALIRGGHVTREEWQAKEYGCYLYARPSAMLGAAFVVKMIHYESVGDLEWSSLPADRSATDWKDC